MANLDFEQEWNNFKTKFERKYEGEEEAQRKEIFKKFFERMIKHNAEFEQGKKSYSLGINQFADRTEEEIHQGRKPKNFAKDDE